MTNRRQTAEPQPQAGEPTDLDAIAAQATAIRDDADARLADLGAQRRAAQFEAARSDPLARKSPAAYAYDAIKAEASTTARHNQHIIAPFPRSCSLVPCVAIVLPSPPRMGKTSQSFPSTA